jgi:hypothetical protein
MALSQSPKIVTDGLVLYYDMNNTQKSFKGQPITNNYLIPTPAVNGNVTFSNQGTGIFQRITSGNYGGYTIQPTDVVYKYDLGELGCHYHGNSISVSAGQIYTFSFDYYISANTAGYPSTNYLANMECYETVGGPYVFIAGNSVTDPTTSIKGVWKSASFSVTIPASTTPVLGLSLYPGACGNTRLANTGSILYKNPQVELNNFVSPFVAGTRSNTQSIISLTNQNTITANSLTYASNNTFSFNGSNNFITISTAPLDLGQATYTISAWFRANSNNTVQTIYEQNAASGNSLRSAMLIIGASWGFNGQGNDAHDKVPVRVGQWVYGVITVDKTLGTNPIKIYENGVLYWQGDSSGGAANLSVGTAFTAIGKKVSNTEYFNGTVSAVQIYNRVLSAGEVQQNFNALRGRYGI